MAGTTHESDETVERLLTCGEAARFLGVGTTSIKRWTDAGMIRCVRTAGRHRRFAQGELERFRDARRSAPPDLASLYAGSGDTRVDRWVDALVRDPHIQRFAEILVDERARSGAWWRVAESLLPVLNELGERWLAGRITIIDEHFASERLGRALASVCERLPVEPSAPLALLALAPGDEHTLGLSLAELCLAEAGWRARWLGRFTPIDAVRGYVDREPPDMVVAGASSYLRDNEALERYGADLGEVCERRRVTLVFGGGGAWPDPPVYGLRLRSYAEFADTVRRTGPSRLRR